MSLMDSLLDSIEVEKAIKSLKDARTPQELVSLWWECCDGFEGHARKLAQAEYSKQLQRLTGAMA